MTAAAMVRRMREAATPARVAAAMLRLETALTMPIFVLAFYVGAAIGSARAGWRAAQMKSSEKRALLELAFGAKKAEEVRR